MPFTPIGNATSSSFRKEMHVERILGDVDADDGGDALHAENPSLQMRARSPLHASPALAAVRAVSTKPTTIPLSHGLSAPEGARSIVGHGGKPCSATLRKPPRRRLN